MKTVRLLPFILAVFTWPLFVAYATPGKLKILSADRYQRAYLLDKHGAIVEIGDAENVVLALRVRGSVAWSEDVSSWYLYYKDIRLEVDGSVHECLRTMQLGEARTGFQITRPSNWQGQTGEAERTLIFLIPRPSKNAVLVTKKTKLKVPVRFSGAIKPTMPIKPKAKATIVSAKLLNQAQAGTYYDDVAATVRNPFGKILELTFIMQPSEPNLDKRFHWPSWSIQLLCDNGHVVQTAGTGKPGEPFSGEYEFDVPKDHKTQEWNPQELTYYFAVPANLKRFKLLHNMLPIGEGSVSE